MSNAKIEIKLKLTDRFSAAFPDMLIPNNSYLDKSKTGLGMTYAEFHADRHSIIVIPYTSIIDLKVEAYKDRNTFKIVDEIKPPAIEAYLRRAEGNKKLITTPEGFKKIIEAAKVIDKLDWLYSEFFCLLDEAHCYAVDAYRKYILVPFDYFWEFKNKALGTATYYPYSDPRFAALEHYKILYDETFGDITIVDNENPRTVIIDFLTNPDQFPGNVHIFYNSVQQIEKVIRGSRMTDVLVHCRDDERNHKILADQSIYFRSVPTKGSYKKFNFYSMRYYDGWDLFDNDQATIILVTDVNVKHTVVGIPYNGFQAIGRLRKVPHHIYHVTNNFGRENKDVRSFEQIEKSWYYQATNHVGYYNDFKVKAAKDGMDEKEVTHRFVEPFCKFTKDTQVASVFPMKVDQHVCQEYSREGYANIEMIQEQWKNMNYETKVILSDLPTILIKGLCKSAINKRVVEVIKEHRNHPERYLYHKSKITMNKLKDNYQILFTAMDILFEEGVRRLGYDDKKMERELVSISNKNLDDKLKQRLEEAILLNKYYTVPELRDILQEAYDDLGYKDHNGKSLKAKAKKIIDLNIFTTHKTQINNPDGTVDGNTGKIQRISVWWFSV
jgi:hypothetical protein